MWYPPPTSSRSSPDRVTPSQRNCASTGAGTVGPEETSNLACRELRSGGGVRGRRRGKGRWFMCLEEMEEHVVCVCVTLKEHMSPTWRFCGLQVPKFPHHLILFCHPHSHWLGQHVSHPTTYRDGDDHVGKGWRGLGRISGDHRRDKCVV